MSGCLTRTLESQSLIKPAGGIDFQHLEFYREMRSVSLIQELLDQLRSDALILLRWRDFDRRKKNLIARTSDGDVSNRLAVLLDDQE